MVNDMAILVCPTCSTQYKIDDAKLVEAKKFRCKRCKTLSPIQGNILTEAPFEDTHIPEVTKTSLSTPEDEFALAEKMLEHLEASEDIETIFRQEGELLEVSGNTPLLLNTSDHVWLVNSGGTVDIFTVRIEDGKIIGARTHLLRLLPGHIFFDFASEKYGKERALLAVGGIGSSVLQLSIARVKQLAQEQEFTAIGIAALVDQWVTDLTKAIQKTLIPKDFEALQAHQEIQLAANVNITSEKGVLWVQHLEGAGKWFGLDTRPFIEGNELFPIPEHAWLQTAIDTLVRGVTISDCITHDLLWKSLEKFHAIALDFVIASIKEFNSRERLRLQQKKREETSSLRNAFSKLASVVRTAKQHDIIEETPDPLLAVCRIIGKYSGISFKPHPSSREGVTSKDPLQDIVRASRARVRQVVLKDQWWRQDNGAFLAYKTEGNRPVALIPNSSKSYRLVDPVEGTIPKVTAELAESLEATGYIFYRPFPEHPLNLWGITKFGFRGLGMDITVILTVATLGALLGLLPPIFTGRIFNSVIPESNISQLTQLALILLVTAITMSLFEITKAIGLLRVEGKLDSSVQAALWDRLLALPVPFFREYTAGDLANRSMGINAIRQIFSGTVVQALFAGIFSVFYWGLLFYYNWELALVATVLGLTAILCTSFIGYYFVRYQKPIQALEGRISGLLLQLLTGINKLRITGTEDRAFALWSKEFSEQKKISVKSKTTQNVLKTFNAIFPVIAAMIIFSWVVYRIKDSLTIGDFLAFNTAYLSFQFALIQMSLALVSALTAIPIYTRLQPILTSPVEIDETKSSPPQLTGDIEINQVHFRYKPDGPLILHDISLKVNPGEFVAFVGSSGSGKSTLMRLLLGFEKPESGTIYCDGQDLDSIDLREVRQQIGVVLQNSRIMQGTILENITGSSTLTINDAWEAARMAGCEEDIREMPMQMHTVLPPGGGTLSGGQRQRILIARAVVKKPRILIFDEATSALDNRTQEIVSKSIEKLQATRIVIAHRLSTIMHADRIYVLEKGHLVQSGTYEELINREGVFAELAKRQLT